MNIKIKKSMLTLLKKWLFFKDFLFTDQAFPASPKINPASETKIAVKKRSSMIQVYFMVNRFGLCCCWHGNRPRHREATSR